MSRSVRPARRRLHRALCACAPARPRASLPGPPRYIPALTGSLAQVGTGIVRCGKCKELLQIKRPPCKHGTMRTGLGGYQACPHWRARTGSAIASTSFPMYAHVHACMFPHPSPTARCGVAAPHSAGRRGAHVTLPKPLAETLNWQDPTQCFCERLFKCCPTASAFYLAILTTSFIIGTGFVRCVCVCACVRVRACVRVETYMAGQPSGIMPLYARACKHTHARTHTDTSLLWHARGARVRAREYTDATERPRKCARQPQTKRNETKLNATEWRRNCSRQPPAPQGPCFGRSRSTSPSTPCAISTGVSSLCGTKLVLLRWKGTLCRDAGGFRV